MSCRKGYSIDYVVLDYEQSNEEDPTLIMRRAMLQAASHQGVVSNNI